jgi:hypothetical protein
MLLPVAEAEHILDDNIDNHPSDSEGEEEDEENPDEDDLGPEDGEGGFLDAELEDDSDEGYHWQISKLALLALI